MFASNFPVDSLRHTFAEIFSSSKDHTRVLRNAERRALFHDNAVRIYRRMKIKKFPLGYVGVGLMGGPMVKRLA